MTESKITIHMVSSLDGFIAKADGDISWFESKDNYEKGVTGESAEEFMKGIDYFVMGSRTYELALELSREFGWAYGDVPTVVLSHRSLPINGNNIELYSGELVGLVNDRLKPAYRNIWIVGGARLTQDFIKQKLADDIRLSILPVMLGGGTRFLDHLGHEQLLHLKEVMAYKTGMVELWYEIRKQ
ncbi:MAG TPA: dihydrofolate reductase family protein [Chryseolinea sp.]|nr:dihydrofolate reductase family protein [Chryseolinea sp.]